MNERDDHKTQERYTPASGKGTAKQAGNKGKPVPEGMAPRRAALRVVRDVTEEGKFASLSLDAVLRNSSLSDADRRLAARLAYDTINRLAFLDYLLDQVMARKDTDIKLKNILRLGACQIFVEDRIPESAATNTSVQLCSDLNMDGLKGVCNGILRNLIRRREKLLKGLQEPGNEENEAIFHSIPLWLWRKLKAQYRQNASFFSRTVPAASHITIRPNLTRTDEESFANMLRKKVWKSERGTLPHSWWIRGAKNIAEDNDFRRGIFSIQSEGSMMICLALRPQPGNRILDCCAAPGGKSCYLAELIGGTGRIQAWDLHEHRVSLIEAQAKRLGLDNIRPIVRDATRLKEDLKDSMDAVLLDAPCSGTGVMNEKPDIKLRLTEDGLESLKEAQRTLLQTVSEYVRPGGVLVYSTCSVLREENEEQIAFFLENHPEFTAEKLPETIPEQYRRYEETGLQLLPFRDGTEGFYLCRMRRKALL